jgi:hypothetical protein
MTANILVLKSGIEIADSFLKSGLRYLNGSKIYRKILKMQKAGPIALYRSCPMTRSSSAILAFSASVDDSREPLIAREKKHPVGYLLRNANSPKD